MKTGSQDISPPKDTEDAAQPAEDLKTEPPLSDHPAGPAPEEAQPAPTTGAAAVPSEDDSGRASHRGAHALQDSLFHGL